MDFRKLSLVFFLACITLFGLFHPAQAMRGVPESPDFGLGVRINLNGPALTESILAAAAMQADWLAVDFDWSGAWPERDQQPDLANLDLLMQLARENSLPVLFGITHAPRWAQTPAGPSADLTAWFLVNILKRYPQTLAAIELFPSPNTFEGWGAPPDPAAYAVLYQYIKYVFEQENLPALLVTGGIQPTVTERGSIAGADFLSSFYSTASLPAQVVIGTRLEGLSGEPTSQVGAGQPVLRDYETLRQVMITSDRGDDLLWVTSISSPEGSEGWVIPTLKQMRSQLFIGSVFYTSLNPATTKKSDPTRQTALVQKNGKTTALFEALQEFNRSNNRLSGTGLMVPGVKYKQLTKTYNRPPYP